MVGEPSIEQICSSLAQAISQAREVFRTKLEVLEIHDRFWCLQDQLTRAVEAASDTPREFFAYQQNAFPSLFTEVIDLITFASKTGFSTSAAVNESCNVINDLLLEITSRKASLPKHQAATA